MPHFNDWVLLQVCQEAEICVTGAKYLTGHQRPFSYCLRKLVWFCKADNGGFGEHCQNRPAGGPFPVSQIPHLQTQQPWRLSLQ
jgi:hypothetical protein